MFTYQFFVWLSFMENSTMKKPKQLLIFSILVIAIYYMVSEN